MRTCARCKQWTRYDETAYCNVCDGNFCPLCYDDDSDKCRACVEAAIPEPPKEAAHE